MSLHHQISSAWNQAFSPVDRRHIWQWCEDNIALGANYTITGRFRLSHSPYLRAPFEALHTDSVRVVHLRAPPRSGKSMLADLWVPWIVCNDPGPCMWNMQTDPMAKDHAKMRVHQNFALCPPLQELLPRDRHSKNIQEIHFSNGMPLIIQGPSESNLQGKGIRYLINDEIWCWRPGRIYQAYARTKDFEKMGNAKILNISQGGMQDDDEDAEYKKGSQHELHVRCLNPECEKLFTSALEWNQTTQDGRKIGFCFDDSEEMLDEAGDWKVTETARTVQFLCPHCGHSHADTNATRRWWLSQCEYVSKNTKAEPDRKSYHFEASVVRSWRGILSEYLHAMNALRRGVIEQIKAWHQKERAQSWSELLLLNSRPSKTFDPGIEAWDQEHVRFFTLDFQDDDVWWGMICSWSRRGESRRLWFGRLTSESEILARQAEFKVLPAHVGMDCGFKTKRVYAMCVRHGWIAFRGDHRAEFNGRERTQNGGYINFRRSWEWYSGDPETGTVHAGRRFAYVVRWSNPTIKDRLSQHMARGLWVVPATAADDEKEMEYKRQISAEYKKQKRNPITGQVSMEWVCPSGNNHLFDCAAEQILYATLKRILPDIESVPVDSAA